MDNNNVSTRSKLLVEMCRKPTDRKSTNTGQIENSASDSNNNQPILLITVPPDEHIPGNNVEEYPIDPQIFHTLQTTAATLFDSNTFDESMHNRLVNQSTDEGLFLDTNEVSVELSDLENATCNIFQSFGHSVTHMKPDYNELQCSTNSYLRSPEKEADENGSPKGIGLGHEQNREQTADMFSEEGNELDSEGEPTYEEENTQNIESDEENITTKKRKRKPVKRLWMREKNKRLRERGLEYTGFKKDGETKRYKQNAPKPERKMGQPCDSNLCKKSKLRSCSDVSEEKRTQLFEKFWKMTWDQRKLYVVNNVTLSSVKRRYTKNENSSRNYSMFYSLRIDGQKVNVCKKLFLSTLCLGEFQVSSWVKTAEHSMHESKDFKNENRVAHLREKKNNDKEFLIQFFNELPTLPSHYCRQTSSKLYLDQTVPSKTALYKEYVSKCNTENKKSMSRRTFDDLFEERNLAIYQPKKDRCDLCCQYEVGNLEEELFTRHIAKKDRARQEKAIDVKLAEDEQAVVLMMDLQAVKVCPSLNASAVYFKTKLCCHNFTVMNVKTKHVMCYWFSEVESDLSASTFASLVVDYISRFSNNSLPIIIYSDGCTYQNRNNILANALLSLSVTRNQTIEQKYLERGHTQMQCDSVHSRIEAKIKESREINLPSTYLSISREARKNPFPYCAEWVNYDHFRDFSQKRNQMYGSIRPGKKNVTDIRAIKYTPDGTILYKFDFDDSWTELPQRRCRKEVCRVWPQLNPEKRKIKAQKYKHLQELKSVIPVDCHHFYDNLSHI